MGRRVERWRGPWWIAGAVALLVGCALEPPGPLLHEDLGRLQRDLARLEQSLQQGRAESKADLQRTDRRVSQQLGELQRGVGQLVTRTDEIGGELGRVHGKLDELRYRLDAIVRQQEGRSAPSAAAPPPAKPPEPTGRTPEPGRQTPSAPAQQGELYQTAYNDYTKGNYSLAIAGFREFIRLFPDSDLADDAQYYIGEARFSMAREAAAKGEAGQARQEYERAAQEFRQVLIRYPQGSKAPTALYKEGLTQLELGNQTLAEARFQYLVDNFPGTPEALKAKDDLARLKSRKP